MDPVTISLILAGGLKLIDMIAAKVEFSAEDGERFDKYRSLVEGMIKEGRVPTAEEWEDLMGDMDEQTRQLLAARASKPAPPAPV